MKTFTTPLSKKDRTTRNLAYISLIFLPLHRWSAIGSTIAENPYTFPVTFSILHVVLVIVARATRNRATAIVALILPFASMPIAVVILLFRAAGNW